MVSISTLDVGGYFLAIIFVVYPIVTKAAHCFEDERQEFSNFFIIAGKIKRRSDDVEVNQQKHDIESIITPNYVGKKLKYQNNIAIIRTKNEITYNKYVSPICLINEYFPYIKPNAEVPLMTAGWRKSEYLMSTTVWFRSYFECVKQNRKCAECRDKEAFNYISREKFCAVRKHENEIISETDSGSGLVMKGPNEAYFLVGIVHNPRGLPKISPNETMCTYVPLFHHWILETIYLKETENKR